MLWARATTCTGVSCAYDRNICTRTESHTHVLNHIFSVDFDCNACAVTIGIQAPESGGEFEYAPCIGRENHSAIQHVMSSRRSPCHLGDAVPPEHAEYVPTHLCAPGEGTLTFFRGGASLHRVKPVHGSRLRLVAALQFHTSDDSFDPPAISQLIYGVQPADHLGPKLRVVGFPSSSGQLLSA
mmetsp:Transcript_23702/g.51212  ORF Transcript_23702/g.51212 Transcript_23702/m.51212 type:complete len:183 (+) Transcript_23702:545-1093(+)